jgi:hypothetical protein
MFRAVISHPSLLPEASRAVLAVRERGRLLPSEHYLDWRMHTAYGNADGPAEEDLLQYLRWRRRHRRMVKWGRRK